MGENRGEERGSKREPGAWGGEEWMLIETGLYFCMFLVPISSVKSTWIWGPSRMAPPL